jgi:hypothetical protein
MVFQAIAPGSTTVRVPNLTVKDAQGTVVASGMPQMVINVR